VSRPWVKGGEKGATPSPREVKNDIINSFREKGEGGGQIREEKREEPYLIKCYQEKRGITGKKKKG